MAYKIEFAKSTKQQLEKLTANQRAMVFESITKQLVHQPLVETHKRKLLRPNPVAP
jgi:mRNA-degrading endonuclease RelE of RelBE toxin-antitoxin system